MLDKANLPSTKSGHLAAFAPTALACLAMLLVAAPVTAQPDAADAGLRTLQSLAEQADAVALIQVWDIDYKYVRDFPNEGTTIVDVLIGYKGVETGEQVEILEQGLKIDNGCYYPDRENEGHRFLAFLERDEKGDLRGEAPYCRLPVFVTEDNRYALLAPVAGVSLPAENLVRSLNFSDPHAFIDTSDMSGSEIREVTERFAADYRGKNLGIAEPRGATALPDPAFLPPDEDALVYTRGVYLSDARRLMFPTNGDQPPSGSSE